MRRWRRNFQRQAAVCRQRGGCQFGCRKGQGRVANEDNKLWPGAFAEVQQTVTSFPMRWCIPLAAISPRRTRHHRLRRGRRQGRARPIKLVYSESGEAAVTGIKPGDSVVQEGKQNLRPNVPVVERAKERQPGWQGWR